jgi:hypothetical protein
MAQASMLIDNLGKSEEFTQDGFKVRIYCDQELPLQP